MNWIGRNEKMDFEECIRLLLNVHFIHPELRMCQVLSIAAHKAGWTNDDLFYCPDSTILKGLELLAEQPESEEFQNG